MSELTDDALCGDVRILQRRRGHRYSLDDVATAWEAAQVRRAAARYLDLGCGIGSVLLMVAYKVSPRTAAGIEAQDESIALARQNVERAELSTPIRLIHGDIRDRAAQVDALAGGPFDLITGTPPYMPVGTATPSPDPQRAHARVELRGGVEDYLAAAAGLLAPGGALVVCADARRPERVLVAARPLGLVPVALREVVPRAYEKSALFTVWTLARAADVAATEPARLEPLVARDQNGGRTAQAHALRRFFDLPVDETEAPSP